MAVVKLSPCFKDYIWGGTRLRDEFGKQCPFDTIAESWELACHKDGSCTVASGEYKGLTLEQYIDTKGKQIMGTSCENDKVFPVLVKLIDAKNDLSVQVHPDDEYAMRTEGEPGKTEMWYVIDCLDGAELIYGFKEKVTPQQFAGMIRDNTLLEYVNKVRVKKGDVFFIPSGTLHAIGKGILVAEIQQNSNTTYRVYDYGRVGNDGKPRELHIDKAIDVTDTKPVTMSPMPAAVEYEGYSCTTLADCKYFTAVKYDVQSKAKLDIDHRSFAHLLMIDGEAKIDELIGKKGDSFFIDASSGSVRINGRCSFILSRKLQKGIDIFGEK